MEHGLMWIAVTLGILLVLLPVLIGLLISPYQQVTRVELIKAPADEVWNALADLPQQTQWRADLKSMQTLDDDAGLRWVEQSGDGNAITLRKLKEIPRKELLLDMQQNGSKRTRQACLNAVPGGTRVTFTEMLETRTPLGRIKTRINGGPDRHLDHFIQQLKARFTV